MNRSPCVAVIELDDDDLKTLAEARERAQRLLTELLRKRAEIEADPPDLPLDKLAAGRLAMQKAIESAERALQNLDEAMKVAVGPLH
jgi:predicted RNase H-like HicB family nuclease